MENISALRGYFSDEEPKLSRTNSRGGSKRGSLEKKNGKMTHASVTDEITKCYELYKDDIDEYRRVAKTIRDAYFAQYRVRV